MIYIFSIDRNQEKISNVVFDEFTVEEEVPIFNYVCSPEKPITWGKRLVDIWLEYSFFYKYNFLGRYMDEISVEALNYPSMRCIWYYFLILNKHLFLHQICTFFMHLIPAYIADAVLYILGRKPM